MKLKILIAVLVTIFFARQAEAQATQPATQPAGFAVHGKVKIGANLDVMSPNLSRVVIFVESDPVLDATALSPVHAEVAQRNKAFVPNFLVIPRNTTVEFPNWDHFYHNVFSRSAAAPAFDMDRYPYGQSKSNKFDKVGVVQVFCNIHPSMKALIFVTPNPFFTHADADGNFKLGGLPAGKFVLTAWQERCAPQHQSVEVGPGLNPEISFALDEDRENILTNDPPQHSKSYGVDRGLGVKREQLNLRVIEDAHPAPTTEPCPDCN